jgi:hypothetical protein
MAAVLVDGIAGSPVFSAKVNEDVKSFVSVVKI